MRAPDRCERNAEAAAALLLQSAPAAADRERAARLLLEGCQTALFNKLRHAWRFDEADAEEIVVQVIMAFLKDPPRQAPPRAWLFSLLAFKAKDAWRSRQRRIDTVSPAPDIDEGDAPVLEGSDEGRASQTMALRRCLEEGLAAMRRKVPVYAALLEMVADGWTTEEVAEKLGVSPAAAKDRVFRVRENARHFFSECREWLA